MLPPYFNVREQVADCMLGSAMYVFTVIIGWDEEDA